MPDQVDSSACGDVEVRVCATFAEFGEHDRRDKKLMVARWE